MAAHQASRPLVMAEFSDDYDVALTAGTLRLWALPASCSMVPHILLRETGLKFELVIPDRAELSGDKFREINPKQLVPVLAFADEVVTEVPAIIQVLSYLAPQSRLLGAKPFDTVRAYEWLNWLSGTVQNQAISALNVPARFSNDPSAFESINAKATDKLIECLGLIELKLLSRVEAGWSGKHALGNIFTAVDAFLFVLYRWASYKIGKTIITACPYYTALFIAIRERPAVQATLNAENLHLPCDSYTTA